LVDKWLKNILHFYQCEFIIYECYKLNLIYKLTFETSIKEKFMKSLLKLYHFKLMIRNNLSQIIK